MPIRQFLYFDSLESLPAGVLDAAELQPTGSRYDAHIAVFGRTFQAKLGNSRYFIVCSCIVSHTTMSHGQVGAGAIGCEHLKHFAMMGLGGGPQGKVCTPLVMN